MGAKGSIALSKEDIENLQQETGCKLEPQHNTSTVVLISLLYMIADRRNSLHELNN